MAIINLGILAHVDAGKTTLTERLLHVAGVIDNIGRVDDGTTRTDSLELEKQRGITIKSAVVSFDVDGLTVNLLDTPGHSDFIAEVERVLGVLDGAVLVVSAVEGVQSQTVLLFRALRRLRIPTVIFINKIDRVGASPGSVVDAISERLGICVLPMNTPVGAGSRSAHIVTRDFGRADIQRSVALTLAEHDESLLRLVADERATPADMLTTSLASQVARGEVFPTFFGAALQGLGIEALLDGIRLLAPAELPTAAGEPTGTVFKIERTHQGEKIAFVRLFRGTLGLRDRIHIDETPNSITGIEVFEAGTTRHRPNAGPGAIVKVHGLTSAFIGATFGAGNCSVPATLFDAPTLETVVVPRIPHERGKVYEALTRLSEADPLINLRQDQADEVIRLSVYGEVQKEIIAQTLALEFGCDIGFRPTTPVCIERLAGTGSALELIPKARTPHHPLLATVGLSVSPLPPGTGISFEIDSSVDVKSIPIHVFDRIEVFREVMTSTVQHTLAEGLHGWQVTDCHVTMTHCDYQAPPRKWPGTTLSDYRDLTPLVLTAALQDAGTVVCEPLSHFRLEFPADVLSAIFHLLSALGAIPKPLETRGSIAILEGVVRAARVHELQSQLPNLTRGEGTLETAFSGYDAVSGPPPSRPRTGRNTLDRDEYFRELAR